MGILKPIRRKRKNRENNLIGVYCEIPRPAFEIARFYAIVNEVSFMEAYTHCFQAGTYSVNLTILETRLVDKVQRYWNKNRDEFSSFSDFTKTITIELTQKGICLLTTERIVRQLKEYGKR